MNEKLFNEISSFKESLQNDERFLNLLKAEKDMENSDDVKILSYKKDVAIDRYNDMIRIYGEKSEEALKANHELYIAVNNLNDHPLVKIYNEAYKKFKMLLNEINEILFKDLYFDLRKKYK